jgi:hypothetical protein
LLTLTSGYVGIRQLRRRTNGRWIPYRGFHFWHHALGLCFGVFVLTWVVSGLFSMNPWGLLEGGSLDEPVRLLHGELPSGAQVAGSLAELSKVNLGGDIVSVESSPFDGRLYMIATHSDGERIRLDAHGRPWRCRLRTSISLPVRWIRSTAEARSSGSTGRMITISATIATRRSFPRTV